MADDDRSAYFSAQFALSHACWLIAYPIAGQLANAAGLGTAALCFGVAVLAFAVLSLVLWPTEDAESLAHTHDPEEHKHLHSHGPHHQHPHEGWEGPEPHSHDHRHAAVTHAHAFVIDEHHLRWPSLGEGQRGASS